MTADTRCVVSGPPVRLDRFLQRSLGGAIGRRRIAAMLAAGGVRVNARPARKGMIVREGDVITIAALPTREPLVPTPLPLRIVHADDDLVAVDKPPGLPSLGGARSPNVASALLARFPEMAAIDPMRGAGLVHRLDTATSGLLLAARHPASHARLRAEFTAKRIAKEYLAIVAGELTETGTIDQPLRRRRGTRGRVEPAARGSGGWDAVTHYAPLEQSAAMTLVRLRMRTGVTHQLRAHMAAIGHPVLGDARYGGARAREVALPFDGQCLHALSVDFDAVGLPRLATEFPSHWAPLCEAAGWSVALLPPVD